MSAKMQRRRRHDRKKRVERERREWREDSVFFATGRVPASATSISMCSCGAVAFTRGRDRGLIEEFSEAHAWCNDVAEVSS